MVEFVRRIFRWYKIDPQMTCRSVKKVSDILERLTALTQISSAGSFFHWDIIRFCRTNTIRSYFYYIAPLELTYWPLFLLHNLVWIKKSKDWNDRRYWTYLNVFRLNRLNLIDQIMYVAHLCSLPGNAIPFLSLNTMTALCISGQVLQMSHTKMTFLPGSDSKSKLWTRAQR